MVDFELISTVVFFGIIGVLIFLDTKNFEFHYGILIRRWDKGVSLIDKFVRNRKNFLSKVGEASIAIGLLAGLIGLALLINFSFRLERAFGLALPTVGSFQYPGPVVSIPFWYWIIGIFLIITTHETMHAIFARLEKIPVKSYGLIFFFVLPVGAFVDPDTEKIKKLSVSKKLKIFSAGSFINLITGLLIVILVAASSYTLTYLTTSVGVSFDSTIPNLPAQKSGLSGTIISINDQSVKNVQDLVDIMNNVKPGDKISVTTTSGVYNLVTAANPSDAKKSYIGISGVNNALIFTKIFSGPVSQSLLNNIDGWFRFLFTMITLSIGIGIANLLPMKPFDGGLIYETIFTKKFGDYGRVLTTIITIITVGLILFNIVGIPIIKIFI